MTDDYSLQVSWRAGDTSPLFNVRDKGCELEDAAERLQIALPALAEAFSATNAVFAVAQQIPVQRVPDNAPAAGTTISAPPPNMSAEPKCDHGPMQLDSKIGKQSGKPYQAYCCPVDQCRGMVFPNEWDQYRAQGAVTLRDVQRMKR